MEHYGIPWDIVGYYGNLTWAVWALRASWAEAHGDGKSVACEVAVNLTPGRQLTRDKVTPHISLLSLLSHLDISRLYPDSRSISDCDTQLSFFGLVCDHCTYVKRSKRASSRTLTRSMISVPVSPNWSWERTSLQNKFRRSGWFHVAFVTFLPSIPVDIVRVISCYTCESSWVGHGLRKQDKASQWWS